MSRSSRRARFPDRTRPAPDARVLVLFCHPVRDRSRVNLAMADAARGLQGVTVHDLYEAYPELRIDVPFEQELLLRHEAIVFQHPFYWYSTPALLKEWQDHVLAFGWAYGRGGDRLRGKRLLSAISTGGPETSYRTDGLHGTTVRALLAPIAQTARLCGMRYLEPFVAYGAHRLEPPEIDEIARRYAAALQALRDAPEEDGR